MYSTLKWQAALVPTRPVTCHVRPDPKQLSNLSVASLCQTAWVKTKQLSSLIWVQTNPICQLHPYVKQHGSRSDQTLAEPDLGPNYLKQFTSTSCQLHPYVKQHGSRSDQTIVEPKPDPNYLQNITPTSCQLHPYVKQHGSRSD